MNRNYLASSIGLLLACAVGAVAAQAAGPAADYKINPEYTSTSPDGATTVEQYARISADGDYTWQFWARHQDKLTLLKPERPDYAAGFRFTSDSQSAVTVSFGRFAAGAAAMTCKRARSTCRQILPRTMRTQLLPSGKKGVLDD